MVNANKEIPTKHAEPQKKMAQTMSDTMIAVLDKLASNGNNLKVDFDALTVGMGPLGATVNGAIRMDIELAK